jgi:hypothetical protein
MPTALRPLIPPSYFAFSSLLKRLITTDIQQCRCEDVLEQKLG